MADRWSDMTLKRPGLLPSTGPEPLGLDGAIVHMGMVRLQQYRSLIAVVGVLGLVGCTGISVAPSCPNELRVNESAPVLANEINPGAIAKYFWEVIPAQVGRVTDPTKPSTMFEATGEGEAVIRLTASDGLYQVISQCQTRVAGTAEPPPEDTDDANDNTADNTNDNVDDGKDNENDNGGRPGGVRKARPPPPR